MSAINRRLSSTGGFTSMVLGSLVFRLILASQHFGSNPDSVLKVAARLSIQHFFATFGLHQEDESWDLPPEELQLQPPS